MSHVEVSTYERINSAINSFSKKNKFSLSFMDIFSKVIIFFGCKSIFFGKFAPIGIISLYLDKNFSINNFINIFLSFLGILFTKNKNIILKYAFGQIIFLIFSYITPTALSNNIVHAILSSASLFISGLFFSVRKNINHVAPLTLECLIVFFVNALILKSKKTIFENSSKIKLNYKEKFSVLVMLVLCLVILKNVNILEVFKFKIFISLFIILLASVYKKPAEACLIGASVGFIMDFENFELLNSVGAYSFLGVFSSLGSYYGKITSLASMVFGLFLMKHYFRGSGNIDISLLELATSSILFLLIPKSTHEKISVFLYPKLKEKDKIIKNAEKTVESVKIKIKNISKSFKNLSDNFSKVNEKKLPINHFDTSEMFDEVANKVCKKCKKCNLCWVKEFNNTYQLMFKLLAILEIKGSLNYSDLPKYFHANCIKPNDVMLEINNLFISHRENFVWKNKVNENRQILCEQLKNVSSIMDKLSDDIKKENYFFMSGEEKIADILEKNSIEVLSVKITKNLDFKYFVQIKVGEYESNDVEISSLIIRAINAVLKTSMVQKEFLKNLNHKVFSFCEKEKFKIEPGVAKLGYEKKTNGDNYAFISPSFGKYVVVLSDGMGTGEAACKISNMAVNLLKELIEAGFEYSASVKLINSIIFLKFPKSTFATLDVCTIDLYSGKIEIIKNGSSSSYIKRDEYLDTICSDSLPVGILSKIETKIFQKTVTYGDYVIIISDGLETKNGDDLWFKNFILNVSENLEPQALANQILTRTIKEHGGSAIDDMTIIVLKIKKNK